MRPILCAALSIIALATAAHADEIRLKDGSKIVGNVVGFEDGSFKVETAYGFALVRKDSIAEIVPTAGTKSAASKGGAPKQSEEAAPSAKAPISSSASIGPSAAPEPKPQIGGGKLVEAAESRTQPAATKPAAYAEAKTQPASAAVAPPPASAQSTTKQLNARPAAASAATPAAQPAGPTAAAVLANVPASPATASPGTATVAVAAPTPPATPEALPEPEPLPVRETIRGNLYVNETYGFQMYRAPDWQLIAAARAALPNAIAALGTSDQSTLLIIGRDRANGSLDAQSADTEKTVQEIYENYRPMPAQRVTIAGVPAIERQFRGLAEMHDWAVTLVTLDRGGDVFTILAMTDANSELVQFEANVISKAISSLQFTGAAGLNSPAN